MKKDIKPGMWLKVQGYVKLNRDGSDVLLDPKSIVSYPHEMRQDTAPVKRVDLRVQPLHRLHRALDLHAVDSLAALGYRAAGSWGGNSLVDGDLL